MLRRQTPLLLWWYCPFFQMFEVGSPRSTVLLRMCVVLFSLLLLDVYAVNFFFANASKASTFYLWLLFEVGKRRSVSIVSLCLWL